MSVYTDELKEVARQLQDDGWNLRAGKVLNAANRMARMEDYIVEVSAQLASFGEGKCTS